MHRLDEKREETPLYVEEKKRDPIRSYSNIHSQARGYGSIVHSLVPNKL